MSEIKDRTEGRFYVGMVPASQVGAGDEIRLPETAGRAVSRLCTVQTRHQAAAGHLRFGWADLLSSSMSYFEIAETDQIEVLRRWGT